MYFSSQRSKHTPKIPYQFPVFDPQCYLTLLTSTSNLVVHSFQYLIQFLDVSSTRPNVNCEQNCGGCADTAGKDLLWLSISPRFEDSVHNRSETLDAIRSHSPSLKSLFSVLLGSQETNVTIAILVPCQWIKPTLPANGSNRTFVCTMTASPAWSLYSVMIKSYTHRLTRLTLQPFN